MNNFNVIIKKRYETCEPWWEMDWKCLHYRNRNVKGNLNHHGTYVKWSIRINRRFKKFIYKSYEEFLECIYRYSV
jgi:hypothetical protein